MKAEWERCDKRGHVLRVGRLRATAWNDEKRYSTWCGTEYRRGAQDFRWEVRRIGADTQSRHGFGCARTLRQAKACAEAVLQVLGGEHDEYRGGP